MSRWWGCRVVLVYTLPCCCLSHCTFRAIHSANPPRVARPPCLRCQQLHMSPLQAHAHAQAAVPSESPFGGSGSGNGNGSTPTSHATLHPKQSSLSMHPRSTHSAHGLRGLHGMHGSSGRSLHSRHSGRGSGSSGHISRHTVTSPSGRVGHVTSGYRSAGTTGSPSGHAQAPGAPGVIERLVWSSAGPARGGTGTGASSHSATATSAGSPLAVARTRPRTSPSLMQPHARTRSLGQFPQPSTASASRYDM